MLENVKHWWRLKKLNTQIARVKAAYRRDRIKAKSEKRDYEYLRKIDHCERFEINTISDEIDQLKSQALREQAWRYGVEIPADDDCWYETTLVGGRALTTKGYSDLRAAIRKEKNEPWAYIDLRLKILVALVGVVATFAGLIVVLKR